MKFWQKYSWIIAITAAVLLLVVVLVFGTGIRESDAKTATNTRTAPVRRADFENIYTTQGNLYAINDLNLSFQVSGVVAGVSVKPGQTVQKNEPIAQLDNRDFQLSLNIAEARYKEAQAKLDIVKTSTAKELYTAQANLRQSQQKLDQVKNGNATRAEVAVAKAALDEAQAKYNNITSAPNANDVNAADAELKKAQASLDKVKAGAGANAIKKAEADLDAAKQKLDREKSNFANAKRVAELAFEQAKKNFDNADAAYKKIYGENRNPDGSFKDGVTEAAKEAETKAKNALDQAKTDMEKANSNLENAKNQEVLGIKEFEAQVNSAQATLDKAKASPAAQELAFAEADVKRAEAFLAKAKQGATRAEIDAVNAEVKKAQASLDKLSSPGTEKDLIIAQTEVDKWQAIVNDLTTGTKAAELNQAQANLEAGDIEVKKARLKVDLATLRAPFDGVVGMVNLVPGQAVYANSSSDAATAGINLTGLTNMQVKLNLDETAIAKVQIGQPALLRLENMPNTRTMTGVITYIGTKMVLNPRTTKYGYEVLLEIDQVSDFNPKAMGIRPGMSVDTRIIVERQPEVLLVPGESIKRVGADKVVDVLLPDGQITTVPVVPGSTNGKETILLEPTLLKPGDRLVLPPTIPNSPSNSQSPTTPTTAPPLVSPTGKV
jgi:HlyD family secretion protein